MSKREKAFEVLMMVLGAASAVLLVGVMLLDESTVLFFLSLPTLILLACSWCVRGKKNAPWIVLGGWLVVCMLLCGWVIYIYFFQDNWLGQDTLVGSFLEIISPTLLTGPLAVLTARMPRGWLITLLACPWLALLSTCIVMFVLHGLGLINLRL